MSQGLSKTGARRAQTAPAARRSPAAWPGRTGAAAACCGRRRAGPAGRVPRRPGPARTATSGRQRSAAAEPAGSSLRTGGTQRPPRAPPLPTRAPRPTLRTPGVGFPLPGPPCSSPTPVPPLLPTHPGRATRQPSRGPAGCWAATATALLPAGHGTSTRFHAASGAAIFPYVGRCCAGRDMRAGVRPGLGHPRRSPRPSGVAVWAARSRGWSSWWPMRCTAAAARQAVTRAL